MVLEVLPREDRVLELPLTAPVDEEPRLGEVVRVAGFSIKLDQRELLPPDELLLLVQVVVVCPGTAPGVGSQFCRGIKV